MSRRVPAWSWFALAAVLALGACTEEKTLSITGVEPSKGKFIGGDRVKILGTGFQAGGQQGITVYFGGKKATNCSINSNTEVVCETPAGEKNSDVDVEVQFDDARSKKLAKAFKYYDPTETAPTMDHLVPGDKK